MSIKRVDYVIGILRTRLHANRHTRHEGRRPPLARRQLGMRRIWNRLLLLLLFGQSPTLAHSLSTQIHFHCDLIVLSCKSEKVLRRRLCCCRMSVTCLFIGHAHPHRSRCVRRRVQYIVTWTRITILMENKSILCIHIQISPKCKIRSP